MNTIQISDIRIADFRGLQDVEIPLTKVTVLTGCNNVGKTSVLKAMQLALGNTAFLTQDDFYISGQDKAAEIVIDIKIISVNEKGDIQKEFDEDWEAVFTTDCLQYDTDGYAFVGLRTKFSYNDITSNFDKTVQILSRWVPLNSEDWKSIPATDGNFKRDSVPFFYIEAQRDIVDDTKSKSSFLGKMLSKVAEDYPPEKIAEIEDKIKDLNDATIQGSDILSNIQATLEGLESAVDEKKSKVTITPFTKKIRDLNKGLTIHYGNEENSFTMDYHGMGTRSWSSLLTVKSFILQNKKIAENESEMFLPIISIEEPEAHLHPDAQKRLYNQIAEMPGQKIISTHSPYIAANADLSELCNLYKGNGKIISGKINLINLSDEEKRRLRQKVINTKGDLIFSRALVLFEGETEEQALPIFAEKYFNRSPASLGIDFVGVGGAGNYFPFLCLAQSFNIPWYIFSDGEDEAVKKVLIAIKKVRSAPDLRLEDVPNVFVIGNKADFEKMLINDGYIDEIKDGLKKIKSSDCIEKYIWHNDGTYTKPHPTNQKCAGCGQIIYKRDKLDYSGDEGYTNALDDIMAANKTAFAPVIADLIVSSQKGLPPLVKRLFDKIKEDFNYE